jgi:hypothetical protein
VSCKETRQTKKKIEKKELQAPFFSVIDGCYKNKKEESFGMRQRMGACSAGFGSNLSIGRQCLEVFASKR